MLCHVWSSRSSYSPQTAMRPIRGTYASQEKNSYLSCYTIRVAPDGAIQYWIHKPGDPFHGLFTRNVKIVRKGLQEPEYISDPAAFR